MFWLLKTTGFLGLYPSSSVSNGRLSPCHVRSLTYLPFVRTRVIKLHPCGKSRVISLFYINFISDSWIPCKNIQILGIKAWTSLWGPFCQLHRVCSLNGNRTVVGQSIQGDLPAQIPEGVLD